MKLAILCGLACLGSILTASARRIWVEGPRPTDNGPLLASRIHFDFYPSTSKQGNIYIVDDTPEEGLAQLGCSSGITWRYDLVLHLIVPPPRDCARKKRSFVKADLGDRIEHVPVCLMEFKQKFMGFSHASHKFRVWYSTTVRNEREEKQFPDTIGFINHVEVSQKPGGDRWALTYYFCMTPGMVHDPNICYCDKKVAITHGEQPFIQYVSGDIIMKGSDLITFVQNFIPYFAYYNSVVLYIVDMDYDKTPGNGGCGKNAPGKVMAIIMDVPNAKSCPQLTSLINFGRDLNGCNLDHWAYMPPQVHEGEIAHEWRVYMVDYLLYKFNKPASKVVEALDEAGAYPAKMCFEEQLEYAVPGACECTGLPRSSSIKVKDVQASDEWWKIVSERVEFDYYPSEGWIYIIDVDHSSDPTKSGCGRADDQKTPMIILAVEVGNEAECDRKNLVHVWGTSEAACLHDSRSPELHRAEGSHQFEAWYTKDKLITAIPRRPVGELREALQESLQAKPTMTSFTKYCLTYHGKNDNECHCVVPGQPYIKALADEGHPWPPTGINQQDFFSRVGYHGQTGAVIYIIDVDGSNWYGTGKCGGWREGQSNVVGILTNVGEPESCEEGSTKVALADGRFGCLLDWLGYRPPQVPVADVYHEWVFYSLGYRLTAEEEASGAELQKALHLREAGQVSLCFHFKDKTQYGACLCPGEKLSPISISGVKISDTYEVLAQRISFDTTPFHGWIYIIDPDYSEDSWLAGCGAPRNHKTLKMVLSMHLGSGMTCAGDPVTLWERVHACVESFDRPVLHPEETSHHFEVWYNRDASIHYSRGNLPAMRQQLQALLNSGQNAPQVTRTDYCLTYGHDDNECRCDPPPHVAAGELQVTKLRGQYPSQEDDAYLFFSHFSLKTGSGGVLYVIDTHYDETAGKGGCEADRKPSGKIMAILTNVGIPETCPDSSTQIALGNNQAACMEDSVVFSPSRVAEGDVMHEWKLYLAGHRFSSAEKSASLLNEKLAAANVPSLSLCFGEAEEYARTGPCRCQRMHQWPGAGTNVRITVGPVSVLDSGAVLAQHIHIDPLPNTGYIYIIDADHDEGPQHAGCRAPHDSFTVSPTKRPKLIVKLTIRSTENGCEAGHSAIQGPAPAAGHHPSLREVCVSKYSPPLLRPGDASHKFEVYWSTDKWTDEEENEGWWFRTKLTMRAAPSAEYCLTYGRSGNRCDCRNPPLIDPGAPQVFKVDEEYPHQGDSAVDFFDHFSISGDSGGVVYVIDTDYDETAGKGGCKSDRKPSGKIMAILTNVGHPESCPGTSTLIRLANNQEACMENSIGFTSPAVPSDDILHEWRIYGSGYRFTLSERSPSTLIDDLEEEKIPRITLCFGEGVKEARLGPCPCEARVIVLPSGGPASELDFRSGTIRERDDAATILEHMWILFWAKSGTIYIIDRDSDEGRGPAGCRHGSHTARPKIILKAALLQEGSCPHSTADINEVHQQEPLSYDRSPVCVLDFSYPTLHYGDSPHRFEAWFTEDPISADDEKDVERLRRILAGSDNSWSHKYCLTFGQDTNECHCAFPHPPEVSIGRVRDSDTAQDLSRLIHMYPLRNGRFYIIDRDHDEGPEHAGCSGSSPTKQPKLILKIVPWHISGCGVERSAVKGFWNGYGSAGNEARPVLLRVCVDKFSPPVLRPGDASHRFEVYWAPNNLDDENLSIVELREKLQETRVPPAKYCLTYGQDTHECLCDLNRINPGFSQVLKVDGRFPSQGDSAVDFFRHFSISGDSGGVVYFIDTHYDGTAGNGGCKEGRRPSGKIMAVLTDVGHPDICPETTTKIDLGKGQQACMEKSFGFTSPAVPSGDIMHEWKIYASGHRFTRSEGSASTLAGHLESERILSVSLCFGEGAKDSRSGPCLCQAGRHASDYFPRSFLSGVKVSDTGSVLAQRIAFDITPTQGWVFIIDIDNDSTLGQAGCLPYSRPSEAAIILILELGDIDCGTDQKVVLPQSQDASACVREFNHAKLERTDYSHRFEAWYTSDAGIAANNAHSATGTQGVSSSRGNQIRKALQSAKDANPPVASYSLYCLTYGTDSNECYCEFPSEVELVKNSQGHWPSKVEDADRFFRHLSTEESEDTVLYVIDIDHDDSSGKGGCAGRGASPSGKILGIISYIGSSHPCPSGWTQTVLASDVVACRLDSTSFYPVTVAEHEVLHEVKIYSTGYRIDSFEGSASSLISALTNIRVPSISLCYPEKADYAYIGPCICHPSDNGKKTFPSIALPGMKPLDGVKEIYERIVFDTWPDGGFIYLIDHDSGSTSGQAGCRTSQSGGTPRIILKLEIGLQNCGSDPRINFLNGRRKGCVRRFNGIELKPEDGSHHFEAWYTTSSSVSASDHDAAQLVEALRRLRFAEVVGASSDSFCLSYGSESRMCHCGDAGTPALIKIQDKLPSRDTTAEDFYRHLSTSGDEGTVLYIISTEYDDVAKGVAGGCKPREHAPNRIISVLTNVGKFTDCERGTTPFLLHGALTACRVDSIAFPTRDDPTYEATYAWKIYSTGYRFTKNEDSVSRLIASLEDSGAHSVNLCFARHSQYGSLGECSCSGNPSPPGQRSSLGGNPSPPGQRSSLGGNPNTPGQRSFSGHFRPT